MPPQTQAQIQSLLDAAGLSPRKRFGQNFLIDGNLMRKLVAAADIAAGDIVLEIGPGTGSLTRTLLEAGARVLAVEIDRGLAGLVVGQFAGEPDFRLIEGDALEGKHALNPEILLALDQAAGTCGRVKLVSNLPYQIATPLIVECLLMEGRFERLVFTIQREVGLRFTAAARGDDYGPVSIIAQSLARVETVANVPPAAFWPRPSIDSVMLRLIPRARAEHELEDVAEFARMVQAPFRQRRKTLRASARDRSDDAFMAALADSGISDGLRPEELSPADWRRLHQRLSRPSKPRSPGSEPPGP